MPYTMGRTRYKIYETGLPYFLTATVVGWIPLFGRPELAEIVLESLRYRVEKQRWTIYSYVLMENHLHWIVAAENLSDEVRRFKSYTARCIIDCLKERKSTWTLRQLARYCRKKDQAYQVWQGGVHPKEIHNDAMLYQKIDYIHYNPVKRGYVVEPTHWRYSSARTYQEGGGGIVPVQIDW